MCMRLLTILLLSASFSVFSIPPDSMVIPVNIGDTLIINFDQDKFHRGGYVSFHLDCTTSVLIDFTRNDFGWSGFVDFTLYYESVKALDPSNLHNEVEYQSVVFIPKCYPGTYYIFFKPPAVSEFKVDISIDTFHTVNPLELTTQIKTYYIITSDKDTLQYKLNLPKQSFFKLFFTPYAYEATDVKSWLWTSDEKILIRQTDLDSRYSDLVCTGTLPKGIYPLKISGHSCYSLILSTYTAIVAENEGNYCYEGAETIALNDTFKAAFFDWTDSGQVDTIDWYRFDIVKESLVKLSINARYKFYTFNNGILDLIYDGADVKDFLIGRLYPGAYYLEASGKSSLYNLFIKTEDISPVRNVQIDSAHLVFSNNFDKKPTATSNERYFMDRNYCLQKAVRFYGTGFLVDSLKINNGQLVNSFTVSFWANIDKTSTYQNLLSIGTVSLTSSPSLRILLNFDNELEVICEDNNGQEITTVPANITSSWFKRWCHFAVAVNNQKMVIYVNGKSVWNGTIKKIENYQGINFGQSRPGQTSWGYFGSLDDFYVFNVALDSADIHKMIDIDFPSSIVPFRGNNQNRYSVPFQNGNRYSLTGQKLPNSAITNQVIIKRIDKNDQKKRFQKTLNLN